MGMFDSVIFRCPNCDTVIEAQSKSGLCNLDVFSPKSVPLHVVQGLDNITCSKCNSTWAVHTLLPKNVKCELVPVEEE